MNTFTAEAKIELKKLDPGRDWSHLPDYECASEGLKEYWYPVLWSRELKKKPKSVVLCGHKIMLMRGKDGRVHALHNRCAHRGVPLSLGKQWFPNTISCAYHGWTYDLESGELVAVITDGPDSRICGNAMVRTYPAEERIGLVWVYVGDESAHPLGAQLPEELVNPPKYAIGGRIEDRRGDWRLFAENGFDEGHAKYLHRTSIWRLFKVMPTWNKIHIEKHGRWLYRVEDERHWEADYPGLGKWSNRRWWKIEPKQKQGRYLGNTGGGKNDPYIDSLQLPGFASLSLPGVLRIAYPNFIHYEFYVPVEAGKTRYVGIMVQFKTGLGKFLFYVLYLAGIRWMFHGNFSRQDHRMVENTQAPPERLYRPDISLVEWRKLFSEPHPIRKTAGTGDNKDQEPNSRTESHA